MTAADSPWLPDGQGLPDEATAIVAEQGAVVHLRLAPPDNSCYPRTGCDGGLGGWWTGKPDEVTCPDCLEVVHA